MVCSDKATAPEGGGTTTISSNHTSSSSMGEDDVLPDRNMAHALYSKYELREVLGRGLSSVVRRCVRHDNAEEFAVKIIDVSGDFIDHDGLNLREQTLREVRILKKVSDHRHIIRLVEVFDLESVIFLVFELCPNGELFDLLTDKVVLTQKTSRRIMRQILEAVNHCHELNVVHRDVKPENILLDEDLNVKLTDFGFAKELSPGQRLREVCGTPGYLAPEILNSGMLDPDVDPGYSFEVDAWACGVTMYTMLSGHPPFWHRNQYKLIRLITRGQYSFNLPEWQIIADETKDLVSRLLTVDAKKRETVQGALNHAEFTSPGQFRKDSMVEGMMSPPPQGSPSKQTSTRSVESHPTPRSRQNSGVQKQESIKEEELPKLEIQTIVVEPVIEEEEVAEPTAPFDALRTFRVAAKAVQVMIRLRRLRETPLPISMGLARRKPYSMRELRGVIDNCAFKVYSHWVKRSEGQNRAALFEHRVKVDARKKAAMEAAEAVTGLPSIAVVVVDESR